ncbi:acyl-CoA dehydrogenase family member 11-like isoform X3 [Centruroides vittatus]|uniref:acyl-CoA dehydrogenase family member 11-like isoform X3 n=1 Tax=Centruroides vittatus TaxID=120091 RepID=UPI0035107160
MKHFLLAGGTETIALHQENDCYKLYGYKWFTSAADSDMSLTLAKISDENGEDQEFQPLSLFYLETKEIDGNLNKIQIIRLKDKLGTRQLPTAELLLDGTTAYKISENGQGIAAISYMLTMTRIHNAVGSISIMRRILNLASDYANRRSVFGSKLNNYPLHVQTLARMETEIQGSLLLLLEVIRWLGKQECNKATDEEVLLFRLLTPILKLYTAKQAVAVVSEGLECFGGQGYMEDTGIASILRDIQVVPIWEGTTNILSLDVLRSLRNHGTEIFGAYYSNVLSRLHSDSGKLQEPKSIVELALHNTTNFIQENPDKLITAARDLAYSLARIYIDGVVLKI